MKTDTKRLLPANVTVRLIIAVKSAIAVAAQLPAMQLAWPVTVAEFSNCKQIPNPEATRFLAEERLITNIAVAKAMVGNYLITAFAVRVDILITVHLTGLIIMPD